MVGIYSELQKSVCIQNLFVLDGVQSHTKVLYIYVFYFIVITEIYI